QLGGSLARRPERGLRQVGGVDRAHGSSAEQIVIALLLSHQPLQHTCFERPCCLRRRGPAPAAACRQTPAQSGPGSSFAATFHFLAASPPWCDPAEMSLGKILVLLLGLAAVAFAVRTALTGTVGRDTEAHSPPRRQLDNVREKAKQLERDQQKAVDDLAHRLNEQ